MRLLATINALGLIVLATLTTSTGCMHSQTSQADASTKTAALTDQPFRLLDLAGQPFELWQHSPDKVTVVIFTRSDCPISNRIAPEICRLHNAYHPLGVDFYLIYVDPQEQPAAIRRHLAEFGYPCLGLRDPRHALVAYCQATTTPEAVVFDKNREMVYRGRISDLYAELGNARSEPTSYDLADAIESTLLGRPVANPRTRAIGCAIADLKH
jgi:cytochrome oxidase Cu insertion factor (SCO1/SenC/PrrC family)